MKILVEVNTEKENEYVYSKIQYTRRHEWRYFRRFLNIDDGSYYQSKPCAENNDYNIISFNEFKSRYESQLKIGDTFEKDGFVCEVKEKIEEKKWYLVSEDGVLNYKYLDTKSYLRYKDSIFKITEITNKEFIAQLEENAR